MYLVVNFYIILIIAVVILSIRIYQTFAVNIHNEGGKCVSQLYFLF